MSLKDMNLIVVALFQLDIKDESSVNIDEDGFVESIVIMTERNCGIVLNGLLEMVTQSNK